MHPSIGDCGYILILFVFISDMGGRGRGRQLYNPRTWANRPEVITRRSMMVGLREAGHSISEVARQMGVSRATAQLWLHRFEREGHVKTRPRSGRPRVLSAEQDDRIVEEIRACPKSSATELTRQLDLPCHPCTTRRHIKEGGIDCYVPAVKETLTEVNREGRLRFAQENIHHGIDFWRKVIFTDEKSFSSVASPGRVCWRPRNTRYKREHICEKTRSGRVSVSVHGWMWYGGPGELVTIDGQLNSLEYINILETSLLPSVRAYAIPDPDPIYFVHDKSPIHTSRLVRDWFARHPEFVVIDWPSKGCDCNPIENLWGIMVNEWGVEEKTRAAVERKTREVWEGIRVTPDICSKLVDSMQTRLEEVIEAGGGWTRY